MATTQDESRLSTPSWLDQDFLQTALRNGFKDPELKLTGFQLTTATAKGDNYLSDMHRATIEYETKGTTATNGCETTSIIIKCYPSGQEMNEIVTQASFFARETEMFTRTLPRMFDMIDTAAPGKFLPFSASCLYTQQDPEVAIVLQDLRRNGFTLAKRQNGLDLKHTLLVLKTLGRFHAVSHVLYKQEPELMERYKTYAFNEPIVGVGIKNLMQMTVTNLNDNVKTWPEFDEHYHEKLEKLSGNMFERLLENVARDDEFHFNVLIHGDLWVNNMMFRYCEQTAEVCEVRFVDYQLPYVTSPGIDLNYFVYTSLDDDVRRNHMQEILREYHNSLLETLDLLGYEGRAITFEELQKEFEDKMFFGLYISTMGLPLIMMDEKEQVDMGAVMKGGENQENKKFALGVNYTKVIKRLLPMFNEAGVL